MHAATYDISKLPQLTGPSPSRGRPWYSRRVAQPRASSRTVSDRRPPRFLEGNCCVPGADRADSSPLGRERRPAGAPAGSRQTRVGLRIQGRARCLAGITEAGRGTQRRTSHQNGSRREGDRARSGAAADSGDGAHAEVALGRCSGRGAMCGRVHVVPVDASGSSRDHNHRGPPIRQPFS